MRFLVRLLQVLGGIVLAYAAFFCMAPGFMLIGSYDKYPLSGPLAGSVILLLALIPFMAGVRLVFNRPSHGGLISPLLLKIGSFIFLLMPVAGLFTGYYRQHPLLGPVHALGFVITFFGLQRLAQQRVSVHAIDPEDPLIRDGVARAQASLPLLQSLWEQREGEVFVKYPFATDGDETEHIWGELLAIEDGQVRASVGTQPLTHAGELPEFVTVPLCALEDWLQPLPDGRVRGGFRTQAEIEYCRVRKQPVPSHLQEMHFVDAWR
jgi:hypothetical protein